MTKFKINLFSVSTTTDHMMTTDNYLVSNSENKNNFNDQTDESNFDMNQKLEKIISQNVMMESYTNKLSKQSNQMIIKTSDAVAACLTNQMRSDSSTTISSMSSSKSHTDSDLTTTSTGFIKNESGGPTKLSGQSTSHHQRALQMSKTGYLAKDEPSLIKMSTLKKPSTPGK